MFTTHLQTKNNLTIVQNTFQYSQHISHCTHCGGEIEREFIFCTQCGLNIEKIYLSTTVILGNDSLSERDTIESYFQSVALNMNKFCSF